MNFLFFCFPGYSDPAWSAHTTANADDHEHHTRNESYHSAAGTKERIMTRKKLCFERQMLFSRMHVYKINRTLIWTR